MNFPVGKKYETDNFFSEAIRFLLNVFLTPAPKLSNRKIKKARLTHGKYLARYVEEQSASI